MSTARTVTTHFPALLIVFHMGKILSISPSFSRLHEMSESMLRSGGDRLASESRINSRWLCTDLGAGSAGDESDYD